MNEQGMNEKLPDGFKMTELGPLPEEWEVVRLGDVAKKMKAGGTPRRGIKEYWGGNIPFVLIEDMTSCGLYLSKTKETITEKGLKNSSTWLVPPNTLLLSMYATIGETAINTIPLATNQAILAIIAKDNFSIVFGAYLLKYSTQRLIMQNIQSTQKNVNKGIVENFKIPLPPLSEQKKIAAVLSAVQSAKEKTEAVIKAAKELKKSLMKHLFTYGPVSPQDAENVPLKETEIGSLPEEWEVVKLGDVLENKNIKFKNLENNFKDTPVLSITREFGLIRQEYKFDKRVASKDLSNYKIVEKGDVVVGFPIDEGVISILFNSDFGVVSPTYEIWQLKSKNIDLYFFDTLLRYDLMMNQYLKYMTRGVERRRIIKKNDFTGLFIPLPPLPVQQKIASILSAVDEKIEAEENKKKALEDLFKTLLHNLMTAKIRVNQLEVTS